MKKTLVNLFIISLLGLKTFSQNSLTIRSNTEGLHIGISGNYAHWTSAFFNQLDEIEPTGLGVGISLGYGINQHFELIGNYDWHTFNLQDSWDIYKLSAFGAKIRYNFGGTLQAVRPFLEAGYNYQNMFITPVDYDGQLVELKLKGGLISVGGGVNFFVSPKAAIHLKGGANLGKFTTFLFDGIGDGTYPDAKVFQFGLGFSYFLN